MTAATHSAPLISIVCCTYNRLDFVQSHWNMLKSRITTGCEVIYALDHCTDGTRAFVDAAAAGDARVRAVENEGAQGLFHCRNFAIAHARGRYIHYLDDDDAVSEGFYAAVEAAVASGLDANIVLTEMVLACEGQPPRLLTIVDDQAVRPERVGNALVVEGDLFDFILHGRLYFNCANALFERSLLERHRFRTEIRKSSDWLLYLEISHARHLRVAYLQGVHAIYYVHSASMSVSADKSYWTMKAFEKLHSIVPPGHPHAAGVRTVLAKASFDAGYAVSRSDKRAALGLYRRAARLGLRWKAMKAIAKLPFQR